MAKREKDITDRNPLTPDEAADLAFDIASPGGSEEVAQVLLLCHALTFEPDFARREEMMTMIEIRLAPMLEGFDAMQHEAMRRQVDVLRVRASRRGGGR